MSKIVKHVLYLNEKEFHFVSALKKSRQLTNLLLYALDNYTAWIGNTTLLDVYSYSIEKDQGYKFTIFFRFDPKKYTNVKELLSKKPGGAISILLRGAISYLMKASIVDVIDNQKKSDIEHSDTVNIHKERKEDINVQEKKEEKKREDQPFDIRSIFGKK